MKRIAFLIIALLLMIGIAYAQEKEIDISLNADQSLGKEEAQMFTVRGSVFSWPAQDALLCTHWTVSSENNLEDSQQCYGPQQCCVLFSLESSSEFWNDDFIISNEQIARKKLHQISSRILYADYSLQSIDPHAEIVSSNRASVSLSDLSSRQKQGSTFNQAGASILALNEDTSGKKITLRVYHGIRNSLDIEPLQPEDNSHYSVRSNISIDYFVYHPSSAEVTCSMVLDNQEIISLENSSQTQTEQVVLDVTQGAHAYHLSCTDTDKLNNTVESPSKSFIADYTPPTVVLNTLHDYTVFADTITLNFTATDNFAGQFTCDLFAKDSKFEDILVDSAKTQTISLVGLENGSYNWNVSCTDLAGNSAASEEKTFFIDTNQNFSMTLNKEEFGIGEEGYYIITAPYNAETTLLVTDPQGDTFFRHYTDNTYPVIDKIDFTSKPGSYSIEAVLIHNNGVKTINKEFTVVNSFSAGVRINKNEVGPGEEITLRGSSEGGIGEISYEWDFGDESTASGREVSHSYSETGTYNIKLTLRDEAENEASEVKSVKVKNAHNLEVTVRNLQEEAQSGASVFIDGEKKETDSEGTMSISVLEGFVDILVIHPGYKTLSEEIEVTQDTSVTYYIEDVFNNASAANSSGISGSGEQKIGPEQQGQQQEAGAEQQQNSVQSIDEGDSAEEKTEFQQKIDELSERITDALYSIGNKDKSHLDTMSDLDIENKLQEAKKNLLRARRDIVTVNFIRDEEDRSQRKIDIETSVEEIEQRTITDIVITNSEEYDTKPGKEESRELLKKYFEITQSKSSKGIIDANADLQDLFFSVRSVKNAELAYLSGEKEQVTIIRTDYTLTGGKEETAQDLIIVESIPKKIAKDSAEIEFLSPHQVLEADPIIQYDPSKISSYTYYIKKEINPDETKSITAVVINPLVKEKKSGFDITGFAIFSTISGIENPVLVIQISLIILLLVIYVCYEFEILVKIKQSDILYKLSPVSWILTMINKDRGAIRKLMKKAESEISKEELQQAEDTYHDMIRIYNDKLSSDLRKKTIDKISRIYNELLVHRIKKKAKEIEEGLAKNNRSQAKKTYNELQDLYTQLPKSWKKQVSPYCKKAFSQLSE